MKPAQQDAFPVAAKKQFRHDKTAFHEEHYGDKTYQEFAPEFTADLFDAEHWQICSKHHAKYVVLTSKHHDGYTPWPNKEASESFGYPWGGMEVGPKRDIVGELTDAVNAIGVRMGLYYISRDWFNPVWEKSRDEYVDKVMLSW